jgi:hypothetical protein
MDIAIKMSVCYNKYVCIYYKYTYIAKMIVNIDLYVREKLFNDDDDIQNNTINEHTETIMSTIYNYMHDNKITRI